MRPPPLERTPCPDCGVGIIGKHMKRHTGSATCRRMQKCMIYTKDMFPNARLVGRLRNGWDPAAVSEALARLLETPS